MSATILLADDSPTIQKVVELTFAETGYQVVAVSGGTELLDRLPDVKPEVVICDVIMPDRDGYEVCQTIKSAPETLHIPVILLTGTFEPFDRDRALAVGCDEIVTKPFEARHLIAAVEKLVKGEAAEVEPAGAQEQEEEYGTFLVAPPTSGDEEEPAEASQESDIEGAGEAEAPAAEPGTEFEAFPPVEDAVPDEGLDFTTTGFAEMEEAGRQPHVPMEAPAEGIEIEDRPLDVPIPEREEAEPEEFEAPTTGEPIEPPATFEADEEAPVVHGPSDTAPVEPPEEPQAEFVPDAEPETIEETPAPESDIMAEAPVEEPEPEEEPAVPRVVESAPPIGEAVPLSSEDIDRIAQRVLELYQNRLEQIAWEVIPDMAEIVVRERVRQIEDAIEDDDG